ncbi:multiple sugar transport system substrate-binding protein [Paenibacillus algorifonticola]|uniref:Multiple sugar transport system substrate-binding protein n=1 Tax=Paenibacillus algorifonticola TaxID=684063 RepID=A0A1I2C237_9BACL|nr:sugar ABC transporter substrate-binding protein [Paenibacillus algorifonticola]SFE62441.1 multiple sugar transport system substrate-binding protein [Paenibacillus algorifonticola]
MKKAKRLNALALSAVFTMTVILTACSSNEGSPENQNGIKPPKEGEQVTLKFSFWGDTIEKKTVTEALKRFEQETGIIVEPMHVPSDYLTKLTTMVAGNVAPDLGYLSSGAALSWAEDGKLLNLTPLIESDPDFKKEDYLDQIWYDYAPGKTIGMSTAVEGYGLMYNKDMLLDAGVELPPTEAGKAWDWDTFIEYSKKLTLDDTGKNALDPAFNPDKIKQYGFQYDPYNMMAAVVSNGGNFLTEDGTGFGLTEPEAIEAIQKLADLMYVHHVSPTPLQTKSLPDMALQTKKVAMTVSGNWALQAFAEQDFNLGVGVLPKLKESNTLLDGAPTVIFSSTKHPEEAWLLYKYMADPESVLPLIAGGLWMPLKKSWYTDPELISKWASGNKAHPEGYTESFMKQTLENGIRTPGFEVKNLTKINALVTPALDLVWTGKETAEQALKGVEPKVEPLIQGYYGR